MIQKIKNLKKPALFLSIDWKTLEESPYLLHNDYHKKGFMSYQRHYK